MHDGVHVRVGGRMLRHIVVSMLRFGTDGTPYGRLWGEEGGVLRRIRRYEVSTTRRTKRVESGLIVIFHRLDCCSVRCKHTLQIMLNQCKACFDSMPYVVLVVQLPHI